MLLAIAVVYFVFVGYRLVYPSGSEAADGRTQGFLARCRQICEKYGLLPSGDLAKDAQAYLDATQKNRLDADLATILADDSFEPVESQEHPLVGQGAPEFQLLDTTQTSRSLSQLASGRPIVLVFYYGYFCNHCVAQLFGLDKDLAYFHEVGAEVVAISADSPQHTLEKYREYGIFHFPVLSDPDNQVAARFGVYTPAASGVAEKLEHGTFVIDGSGRVVWANLGPEPFVDNQTLLRVLARTRVEHPGP